MSVIIERIVNQGHGPLSPRFLAVHSTANPGATALNHVHLWSRGYAYAVHLVSDWQACYHCVPYDRLCWQVGNGNSTCEGIEICEATTQADFDKGIEIAAKACAERLRAHGWGVDRMHPHRWFSETFGGSDHTDPYPYFARWGYSWSAFVDRVQKELDGTAVASQDAAEETAGKEPLMWCIIWIEDDHAGYKKGTGCLWSPGTGVLPLPALDCVNALNAISQHYTGKDLPVFHSSSKAPWVVRFEQLSRESQFARRDHDTDAILAAIAANAGK